MKAALIFQLGNIRTSVCFALALFAIALPSPAQQAASSAQWQTEQIKDPMTDQVLPHAMLSLQGSADGAFKITASCLIDRQAAATQNILGMSGEFARLEIRSATQGLGFARAPDGCAQIDVRLDSSRRSTESSQCSTNATVDLDLPDIDIHAVNRQTVGTMHSLVHDDGTPASNGAHALIDALSPLITMPNVAVDARIIHLADALRADSMRVGLLLTNGDQTVLNIPMEPTFKNFLASCAPHETNLNPSPGSTTSSPIDIASLSIRPYIANFGVRNTGFAAYNGTHYTADQFATKLPEILHKAAVEHGLPADSYDKEIDFIATAVKACSQITPSMAAQLSSYSLVRLGKQYAICGAADSAAHMYLRDMASEDISMADGHFTGTPYGANPFRPDVGFGILQSSEHMWSEGKGFNVILGIVSDDISKGNLDKLLWNVHIDLDSLAAVPSPKPAPVDTPPNPRDPNLAEKYGLPYVLYQQGQFKSALSLATQTCAVGDQNGCAIEGSIYALGRGVDKDEARGVAFFKKACDTGNALGCEALGTAYYLGIGGLGKEPKRAEDLFDRSCKSGFPEACSDLARCYESGTCATLDVSKAHELFEKACAMGSLYACKRLKDLH